MNYASECRIPSYLVARGVAVRLCKVASANNFNVDDFFITFIIYFIIFVGFPLKLFKTHSACCIAIWVVNLIGFHS